GADATRRARRRHGAAAGTRCNDAPTGRAGAPSCCARTRARTGPGRSTRGSGRTGPWCRSTPMRNTDAKELSDDRQGPRTLRETDDDGEGEDGGDRGGYRCPAGGPGVRHPSGDHVLAGAGGQPRPAESAEGGRSMTWPNDVRPTPDPVLTCMVRVEQLEAQVARLQYAFTEAHGYVEEEGFFLHDHLYHERWGLLP